MTFRLAFASAFLGAGASAIRLWDIPGQLPTSIPALCRVALSANISCGPRLVRAEEVTTLGSLTNELLAEYCDPTCTSSLATWARNVKTRCGSTPRDWGFNITRSGNDIAGPLAWAQRVACLADKTATTEFCVPRIAAGGMGRCDDCMLQYLSNLVNIEYAPHVMDADAFADLVISCSVAPTQYPIPSASPTGPIGPLPTDVESRLCMGTNYTVASGDTCESIAADHGLAIDRFLEDNSIDFRCQSLEVGSTVCAGQKCRLGRVPENATCADLLRTNDFTLTELLSRNPIIHSTCNNLPTLAGRTICLSPPGSDSWDVEVTVSWPDLWTRPPGSWVGAPTAGADAPNNTTPVFATSVGTATGMADTAAASSYAPYIEHCPVTGEDILDGFEWDIIDENCQSLMEPYCSPTPTEGQPPPTSTTFPTSCLPSYVMGW